MPVPFPDDWDEKDARQLLEDYDFFLAVIYPKAWDAASAEWRKEMEEERETMLPFLPDPEPIPEEAL